MKFVKIIFVLIFSVSLSNNSKAQNKKDAQAIKDMCGCYEVEFNFKETFVHSTDTTYVASGEKHDKALEWVELLQDDKHKIVLQHLLIVGKGERQHIIKHWRQDWLYQNTDFYFYDHDNTWKYVSLPKNQVKGQWTQKVYQVDDSPRYEGTATWVHVDGKSYWENEASAPLPRREITIRNDYNVLHRRNRHEITNYGWLHEQDNDKILRANASADVLIAQEKGYNPYKKVADQRCEAAQKYWQKEQRKWLTVRNEWNEIFARKKNLTLKDKVDDKHLYDYLLFDSNYNDDQKIKTIIQAFVEK